MKLKFKKELPKVEPVMTFPVRLKEEAKMRLSDAATLEVSMVAMLTGEGVDRLLQAIDEDGLISVSILPAPIKKEEKKDA